MKKILIASTALIATAGMAAAEVNFSGLARFGAGYNEDRAEETIIISRFRLNVDASTELDSGVRLAARLRGEANETATGGSDAFTFGAPRFQANVGGFRLRVGNISGVIDAGETVNTFGNDLGLEGAVGRIDSFGGAGASFSSSGTGSANGISVLYTTGGLSLAATYTDQLGGVNDDEDYQVGASYAFGNYSVGVAFGSSDIQAVAVDDVDTLIDETAARENDYWLLTFTGDLGQFGFSANIGDQDDNEASGGDDISYGIAVDYDISEATNIRFIYSAGGAADIAGNDDAYGIGVVHALGGEASLRGFIGQDTSGATRADLGINFNF